MQLARMEEFQYAEPAGRDVSGHAQMMAKPKGRVDQMKVFQAIKRSLDCQHNSTSNNMDCNYATSLCSQVVNEKHKSLFVGCVCQEQQLKQQLWMLLM